MSATQLERVVQNQAHPSSWPVLATDQPAAHTDAELRRAHLARAEEQRHHNP